MAAEPTKGTLDAFLRKPAVTIGLLILAGVGAVSAVPLTHVLLAAIFPDFSLIGWMQGLLADQFWYSVIVMVVVWQILLTGTAVCILGERKVSAYMQDRVGPNRVGWLGILQPVADGLKFFLKEDIIPRNVDKVLFLLAPAIALVIALIGFVIIPWTGPIQWPWMESGAVATQVVSIDIGFLYIVAVSSLGVYGVVLAGYASNNKYSFYGGMRATAQMISYEIPLGLGLLIILLTSGSLRLEEIVTGQIGDGGVWNILLHPLAFILMLTAVFAETNRLPFDLAESEQELVGGFHTEYSAMKFAMFFLGEYVHMMVGSALLVALFCGGYAPLPFTTWLTEPGGAVPWWMGLAQFGVYMAKVVAFILIFMAVRWTIPRFRYDQLMGLAWKGLIPIGILLLVGTTILASLGLERHLLWSWAMNVAVLLIVIFIAGRSQSPVTGRQAHLPHIEVRPGA